MPVLSNARWEIFAQELAKGTSNEESYVAAGYVRNRNNAARLKMQEDIVRRVQEIQAQTQQKLVDIVAVDKAWVVGMLVENVKRAMQVNKVYGQKGEVLGSYTYNGQVANRALELIGKTLGIYIERTEVGEPGAFARMTDAELDRELERQAKELGLPPDAVDGLRAITGRSLQ